MEKVRIGIIGVGNIGKYHADYLQKGTVSRCELAALCSNIPAQLEPFPNIPKFTDGHELLNSGLIDAVIIATPHTEHATFGIAALEKGIHAMVEKPIASHKADAECLIAAHRKNPNTLFAGMFQLRVEPRYQQIRNLITTNQLGTLTRINWINTDWFRTEAYYASATWRATWKGEGGGVLLNQCLHNLDTLQWLCGMPTRIRAFCQLGRFHDIEVEDNVTAYLEWANGATGTFIGSSGEAPGTNRLEITGTRGKITLENNKITFVQKDADMLEFSKTATQGFAKPATTESEIPFTDAQIPHAIMIQNFVDAILDRVPLIAHGEEGIYSLELANAMTYSSLLNDTIELPLNAAAWEKKLQQLIADSKVRKRTVTTASSDFASSFRK
jgi:predicted dehydrogenase